MRITWDEPLVRPAGSPIMNGPSTNAYRTDESRTPKARARLAPCTSHSVGFLSGAIATGRKRFDVKPTITPCERTSEQDAPRVGDKSRTFVTPRHDDTRTPRWHWRDNRNCVISWRKVQERRCAHHRSDDGTSSRNCVVVRNGFSETGNWRLCLETRFSRV